jgi:protein SCO1/2
LHGVFHLTLIKQKNKQMKKIFLTFIFVLSFFICRISYAQYNPPSTVEVGVEEHLGETIPLNLTFVNDSNRNITLKQIINKPTILTLVYFDCPGLCSPLLDGVSDVIEQTDMELGKDYQVLTVSFNYNDTPEKAKQKKKNFLRFHSKSHAKDWIYLTGDSSNINLLANAVGFKFKRVGLDYIHPAVITILSPSGKVTRYLYGTHFLPFDLKMAILEAKKGLERPTINRVLEFCFNYDPQGKKYVLDVTKITGIIILFFSLLLLMILLLKSKKRKKSNSKSE